MLGSLFQTSLVSNDLVLAFYNDYVITHGNFFLHSFLSINFIILLIGLYLVIFITIKNH